MKIVVSALVASYVRGDLPLATFQEWFIPATWNVRNIADDDAISLIRAIQLTLAEFLSGDISEEELRRDLGGLAGPISPPVVWAETGGSGTVRVEVRAGANTKLVYGEV